MRAEPNTPWLKTIEQFDDEAIASVAVRLAPMGKIDTDSLLRLHLAMNEQSVATIAARPDAVEELAALASFDLKRLSMGAWRIYKDRIEFLGCKLPVGWLVPERRRVAPGRLAMDGDVARIRNFWLLSAMPCDAGTGEVLLDRCPACLSLLGWKNLPNVWSCQVCKIDLRSVAPKWCPPEAFAEAKELADYLLGHDASLPAPVNELTSLDILKLASWLAHFAAVSQGLFLGVTLKNAAAGFSQLKRWPGSFDNIVLRQLGVGTAEDLAATDVISRIERVGNIMASVHRLPSAQAGKMVTSRLMELLGLQPNFTDALRDVIEPVVPLGISILGLDGR